MKVSFLGEEYQRITKATYNNHDDKSRDDLIIYPGKDVRQSGRKYRQLSLNMPSELQLVTLPSHMTYNAQKQVTLVKRYSIFLVDQGILCFAINNGEIKQRLRCHFPFESWLPEITQDNMRGLILTVAQITSLLRSHVGESIFGDDFTKLWLDLNAIHFEEVEFISKHPNVLAHTLRDKNFQFEYDALRLLAMQKLSPSVKARINDNNYEGELVDVWIGSTIKLVFSWTNSTAIELVPLEVDRLDQLKPEHGISLRTEVFGRTMLKDLPEEREGETATMIIDDQSSLSERFRKRRLSEMRHVKEALEEAKTKASSLDQELGETKKLLCEISKQLG